MTAAVNRHPVERHSIDAVLLDIEGTTTPIAFVYDVLFPFARRHLREYLQQQGQSTEYAEIVRRLRQDWEEDLARGGSPPPWKSESDVELSAIAAYVEWLMDMDRKAPGLKLLQGHIWERGYRTGALTSQLFPDVAPAIRTWHAAGVIVAIYSSGSALAQRLVFTYTPDGDLTPYLSGFFDTAAGPKTSPDSYRRIAAELGCAANRVLFVSDSLPEIEAARAAGCQVRLCARPGNADVGPTDVEAIDSLATIIVS